MKTTNKTTYEVYTYFGRVVHRIDEDDYPLWLDALSARRAAASEAQLACAKYIRETGNDAWVRLV